MAALILLNFAVNAIQAEYHPETMISNSNDSRISSAYFILDVTLAVVLCPSFSPRGAK